MQKITREQLPDMFEAIGSKMADKSEELCAMDARLGDGDLGLTMKKGFGALPDIIRGIDDPDIGRTVMKAGMKMSSIIPSTMGFLMSSGLMTGGKAIAGADVIDGEAYSRFLRGYANGIIKRGKCAEGDRTILDAIAPAASAAEKYILDNPGAPVDAVARAASEAADKGAEATKDMEPKFGKAAVHKKDAAGVRDQGACAGAYLVEAIKEYTNG